MSHFITDPTQAEPYFDLETIRNHNQLIFRRKVIAGKEKSVLQHTFVATNTSDIINDGNVDLEFYLAPQSNSPKDNLQTVVVAKNTTSIVTMGDLDIANTHLNLVNTATDDGHCIVELLQHLNYNVSFFKSCSWYWFTIRATLFLGAIL